jgi:hypothetical protein
LALAANHIDGSIPAGIGNNPYLGFLWLSGNNLSGLLPPSLFNLSSLSLFYAATNQLRGRLPSDLGRSLPSIKKLLIGQNQFTGALPLNLIILLELFLLNWADCNNFKCLLWMITC